VGKPIEPISGAEHWCKVPDGWSWARWDHITDWITYGFTRPMPHVKDGVPIITAKNVNFGRILFESAEMTTLNLITANCCVNGTTSGVYSRLLSERGGFIVTRNGTANALRTSPPVRSHQSD
jgi:hypothetical protein